MQTKELQSKIKSVLKDAVNDILETLQALGENHVKLVCDEDAPKENCRVRVYGGSHYPKRITVMELRATADGTLELIDTDNIRHPVRLLHPDDVLELHRKFRETVDTKTLRDFAQLLNRCKNFPVALHDIITRNGWEDLADDDTNDICRNPETGETVTFNNNGKAVITKH